MSQFNLENVTVFNKDPADTVLKSSATENGEKMEVDSSRADQFDEMDSKARYIR